MMKSSLGLLVLIAVLSGKGYNLYAKSCMVDKICIHDIDLDLEIYICHDHSIFV